MVPAIAGTVWCRLRPARSMVPPIGGTVPGGAVLGSRERYRRLADRVGRAADRNWGFPGRECGAWECGAWECGAWECGAWECGCLGACGGLGMRSPGTARRPDRAGGSGAANRRHGTVPGNCPARGMVPPIGGTVYRRLKWCRPIGRHGSGGGQQSRRPIGRRQRGGGVACVGTPGRPGVLPSCGTAGAARPVWCRLGMVPPGYGAAYWRHGSWRRGSWRRGVAGRERCRAAWCLQLEARFRAGAVHGGAVPGTARGRERGMSKNSLLAWMARAGVRGRYWGRPLENGVWGTGPGNGVGGTAPGCGERGRRNGVGVLGVAWLAPGKRWMQGQACLVAALGKRCLGNGAGGNGVWGCGAGVRGTGKESRSRGRVSQ